MSRAPRYDREKCLEAAMLLFWRKGFHATTLKDLEAALLLQPGSIYAAFESKENLYLLALNRYFENIRTQFRARIAAAPSPLQGLTGFLRSFASLPPDSPARQICMMAKTRLDTQGTAPALAARAQAGLDAMLAELVGVFEAAKAAGELPPGADTLRLARRYRANLNALRMEMYEANPHDALQDLAEDMAGELDALRG